MRKVLCVNGHHFNADQYSLCPKCGKPEDTTQSSGGSVMSPLGSTIPMAAVVGTPPNHSITTAPSATGAPVVPATSRPSKISPLPPTQGMHTPASSVTTAPVASTVSKPSKVSSLPPTQGAPTSTTPTDTSVIKTSTPKKSAKSFLSYFRSSLPPTVDDPKQQPTNSPSSGSNPWPTTPVKPTGRVSTLPPTQDDPTHVMTIPQPVVEPIPQPVVEPIPQPVVEPIPQPVVEPIPQPVVESIPQPVVESIPQPVVEKPFYQPAAWLACTSGTHYGLAFPCKIGRTLLCHTPSGNINVTCDTNLSKNACATITFDPRKKKFHVLSNGFGDWLIYVNDDLLFEHNHRALCAYDTLTVAEATTSKEISFVFLPLCGPEFDWSEHSKEGRTPQ